MQAEGTLSGPPERGELTALERETISRGSVGIPHGWFFGQTPKSTNKQMTLTWASRAQTALFILTQKGPIAFRLPKASSRYQFVNRPERKAIKVTTPDGVETFTPKAHLAVKALDILTGRPLPETENLLEKAIQTYFGHKVGTKQNRAAINFLITAPQPGDGYILTPSILMTRLTITDPPERLGPWLPPVF